MGAMRKTAGEKWDSYVLARTSKKKHRAYNAKARTERRALAEVIRELLDAWLEGRDKTGKEKAA